MLKKKKKKNLKKIILNIINRIRKNIICYGNKHTKVNERKLNECNKNIEFNHY